jgi:8-oxo-dGTP diphosphatase
MKKYVVIMLFTKDYKKVLLVKRAKKPYKNCWNGIGGKIEEGEDCYKAAIRECKEETGIDITNPKLLFTLKYPESQINMNNNDMEMSVIYDFIDEIFVEENEEGYYEWKPIEFTLNSNNNEIAGYSNICQFIKEIYDIENIKKFYNS